MLNIKRVKATTRTDVVNLIVDFLMKRVQKFAPSRSELGSSCSCYSWKGFQTLLSILLATSLHSIKNLRQNTGPLSSLVKNRIKIATGAFTSSCQTSLRGCLQHKSINNHTNQYKHVLYLFATSYYWSTGSIDKIGNNVMCLIRIIINIIRTTTLIMIIVTRTTR